MIPQKIHYIYGLDPEFSKKPFTLIHYLSVISAHFSQQFDITIHIKYEPKNNVWWEKTKPWVTIKELPDVPNEFFGIPIVFPEHKCDYLRLKILDEVGGIYMDMDTICVAPLFPLLAHDFVMGEERLDKNLNGLCNAIVMAKPQNQFGRIWLDSFRDFNPLDWNLMAVRRPLEIALQNQTKIHIEPSSSFFKYDWHHILDIFNGEVVDYSDIYTIHLWESKLYHPILKHITIEDIVARDCYFNKLARKYLNLAGWKL